MPANPRRRLDTLAYRCTPELLDGASVYVRELTPGAKSLWKMFDRDFKQQMNREEVQAPHSVVTNALRCLTGGYVWFDPSDGFLVTLDEVDDDTLRDAFTLMCRRALGTPIDDIDLNDPVPFAARIAETPQDHRLLADYLLTTPGGQPDAATWVYNTVTWELSRRLSQQVWTVDDQAIALRADSSGGLIAWDDPWENKSGSAHALARVRLSMKTFPNIADPVLLVSSSASRVKRSMAYARTVLVEQDDPSRPIVEVAMAGRARVRKINGMALETLARLGMGNSLLHTVEARVNSENEQAGKDADEPAGSAAVKLGGVRPIHSKNYKFSIGRGVGMHHLRQLDGHIRDVLGDAVVSPKVYYEAQGFKQLKTDKLLPSPDDVVRSLATMGYAHLRIACLWSTDETRLRMIAGLRDAYCAENQDFDPVEGVPCTLRENSISTVFHYVPDFLAHGPGAGKADAIKHVPLRDDPAMLVGVWAETEYDSDFDVEPEVEGDDDADSDDATEAGSRPKDGEDAKHQGRRTLAVRGVVSQYMTARKSKKSKAGKPDRDFQAIHSVLDLHRSLGIIDRRISDVMVDRLAPYAATDVAHCGIHVRRQSKQGKNKKAKICITATVLMPPVHDGDAWTLHGWSYTAPQWRPYHEAQVAFHAADYPTGKMVELEDDNAGHKKVAKKIDDALADLVKYLGGMPYTVTVDGIGTRRLWEGLHNKRQGEKDRPGATWLPAGTNHPSDRPVAIVRVNKDMDENVRPIGVTLLDDKGDSEKKSTTNSLYRMESDFGADSWVLVTVPNQFDGAGAGRLGGKNTRWSASYGSNEEGNLAKNEMKANWYTMTALGIYPLAIREGIPAEKLGVMTARLCHQPLAWANRTKYPVQLHAAWQMDLDHPQYRRTALEPDHTANDVGEISDNPPEPEGPEM
jgi:hypothetical protein